MLAGYPASIAATATEHAARIAAAATEHAARIAACYLEGADNGHRVRSV